MTVSSTQSYIEYTGDGQTTTFTIPFYFLLNSDISVIVAGADGSLTEPTYGMQFNVTGAGLASGGSLIFTSPYSLNDQILIYRNPPVTQETKYYENGKFPAQSHEAALDKLTMLIQEYGWRFDSLALKKPNIFSDYYDADSKKISNLADPVSDGDAVNKKFASDQTSSLKQYVDLKDAQETQARIEADNELSDRITEETSARQEADANFQEQMTGNVPLEASAFSPISWHAQTINNSVVIPANVNAWSFGPLMTIAPGQKITIGSGSFWTIANGETTQ